MSRKNIKQKFISTILYLQPTKANFYFPLLAIIMMKSE